jgi:hypothetical protein
MESADWVRADWQTKTARVTQEHRIGDARLLEGCILLVARPASPESTKLFDHQRMAYVPLQCRRSGIKYVCKYFVYQSLVKMAPFCCILLLFEYGLDLLESISLCWFDCAELP